MLLLIYLILIRLIQSCQF